MQKADNSIHSLVRKLEQDYRDGNVQLSKYVNHSMYETVEKVDAYINSQHISGLEDSLGREKPFFNIVTAARNIWYRATDLDRKNIRIKATKSDKVEWLKAFWATNALKEWMRKSRFGMFLNDWGRALATYGSAVVKFVEKNGELECLLVPWNRLIVDPVDFDANPRVEVLYPTPAQLRKNPYYDQDAVEDLITSLQSRETMGGQKKDNRSDYIKIYEVHGELPLSYLTDNEDDEKEYRQQMHVLSFVGGKKKSDGYQDFTLYKGAEAKDPYMITHLIKEDGRTLGIGAVEHLFEAQWMTNHTAKAMKDQLDLASKQVFQTADPSFIGRNVLTQIETGDILVHGANGELTQVNNGSHDVGTLQAFSQMWQNLAQEITSTPDSLRGENAPSGTAWRQVEALRIESHSLFEQMTENKGLHVEDMLRTYIIPHLKKKLVKQKSIATELTQEDASKIDGDYINKIAAQELQNTQGLIDPMQVQMELQNAKEKMMQTGLLREQEITPDMFKNFEWEVECEITDEPADKQAIITTLTTVLQTLAVNPMVLQDPNMKQIFNKILEETGAISPVEFTDKQPQPIMPMQNANSQVVPAQPQPNPVQNFATGL